MLNKLFGKRRVRRGNAVLETALVMPLLIMLGFGTAEYGYFFFIKHCLEGAAREGARAAIVPSATTTNVTQAVSGALFAAGLNSSKTVLDAKYTLTIPTAVTSPATTAIEVDVSATWSTIGVQPLPQVMGGISPTKVVKGTAVMRKEG